MPSPRPTLAHLSAAALLLSATAHAQAALVCAPGAAFCTLDLPHLTLRFDAAPSGHAGVFGTSFGESSLLETFGQGDPSIAPVASPAGEGFTFYTPYASSIAEQYYDSFNGFWRGAGPGFTSDVSLYNVSFIAKAGYQVDSLEFSLTTLTQAVGNGTQSVSVLHDTHQSSTDQWGNTTHVYRRALDGTDTGRIDLRFVTSAAPEGAGGSALATTLDFRILAQVSIVPEPASWMLLGAGAAVLTALRRRRA